MALLTILWVIRARPSVLSFHDLTLCTPASPKPNYDNDYKKNNHQRDDDRSRKLPSGITFCLALADPARIENNRHRNLSHSDGLPVENDWLLDYFAL